MFVCFFESVRSTAEVPTTCEGRQAYAQCFSFLLDRNGAGCVPTEKGKDAYKCFIVLCSGVFNVVESIISLFLRDDIWGSVISLLHLSAAEP